MQTNKYFSQVYVQGDVLLLWIRERPYSLVQRYVLQSFHELCFCPLFLNLSKELLSYWPSYRLLWLRSTMQLEPKE